MLICYNGRLLAHFPQEGYSVKTQIIYVALRVPSERTKGAIRQVLELRRTHPAAMVSVDALSVEGDRVCLYVKLDVPISNTNPTAIAALQFVYDMNLNMYEYMPTYTHPPSPEERELAVRYLDVIMQENLDSQNQQETSAKPTKVSEPSQGEKINV